MRCPTLVFLLIVNCIFLLTGLILLVAFPNWIVNKIAAKVMYIHEDGTGKSSFVTDYWERLPAVHIFKFYMFNITNPDDVMFHGHEPILQELGPYTYEMTEVKENIRYSKDGNLVSYRANKTWVFNPQKSCATCRCEDQVAFPNLVFTALIYYARTEKINIFYRRILDIFILIMRSKPIQNVGVCDILLNSYKDPIIEVIHTPIYKTLKKTLKLTTPDFPDLGYLPKYNRTGDGDFVVMTGKDDIANIGQIVSWNNWTELPWWNTPESRRFKGSGDGINQKPGIGKHDKYEMYQPLACRKFTLEYSGSEAHVNGIPALAYSFVGDSYDGVRNIGYRYENYEKMNYYPGWPCGLNHTVEVTPRCKNVKCDLFENWCDKCCNGSFINETWVLPPGIIPLRCQPARTFLIPMGLFLSTPHYLWSPENVQKSMKGLNPDPMLHNPGKFFVNSFSGHTVNAIFRIQFNVPLIPNDGLGWNKVPAKIVPTFWLELDVQVKQYALDFFYLITVVSQRAVFISAIVCLGISALLTIFLIYKVIRKHRNKKIVEEKPKNAEMNGVPRLNNICRL